MSMRITTGTPLAVKSSYRSYSLARTIAGYPPGMTKNRKNILL